MYFNLDEKKVEFFAMIRNLERVNLGRYLFAVIRVVQITKHETRKQGHNKLADSMSTAGLESWDKLAEALKLL